VCIYESKQNRNEDNSEYIDNADEFLNLAETITTKNSNTNTIANETIKNTEEIEKIFGQN
jgi:hypothetical protein